MQNYWLCFYECEDGARNRKLVTEREFEKLLLNDSCVIIRAFPVPSIVPRLWELLSAKANKIKLEEIVEVCRSIAVMLDSGITITTALLDIAEESENRRLKKALIDIANKLDEGMTLSEALEANKDVFPGVLIKMVSIGEVTGKLSKSFQDTADYLQRWIDLKSTIKKAMTYPIFVFVVSICAFSFWLLFVIPKVMAAFKEMKIKMPKITMAIVNASNYAKQNCTYIFALSVLTVLSLHLAYTKSHSFKSYAHRFFLKLPVISRVLNYASWAHSADYLATLFSTGIPIDESLKLLADSMEILVYRKAFLEIRKNVLLGKSLTESFRETKLFPRFYIRMLYSGESTGTLDKQLKYVSEVFYKKLTDYTEKMGKFIEPLILMFVGTLFGIMMIGMLFPIYGLIQRVK